MANSTWDRLQRIRDFLDEAHVISFDQSKLPWWRRTLHFWMLVGKSFVRNRAPVRASALAYTTLLALIPILAMVVSVSTSFLKKDGEKPINYLIEKAVAKLAPQLGLIEQADTDKAQQTRNEAVQRILDYIENMNSGKL